MSALLLNAIVVGPNLIFLLVPGNVEKIFLHAGLINISYGAVLGDFLEDGMVGDT
jgi:hypothetical protein